MSTITDSSVLRSAFLKIGWAPIVTIGGTILLTVITLIIGINTAHSYSDGLGLSKLILVLGSVIGLTGYIMSYMGFAQAHKAFGITKAGDAFATLKLIFLIYIIIGALFLLFTLIMPTSQQAYMDFAATDHNVRKWATLGIIFVVIYIAILVFTIVSLFIIMNKTARIAATTNIEAMHGCAHGARVGVYCFFGAIAVMIIAAASRSEIVTGLCELLLLGFSIYALVRWIGGWFDGAREVLRHPVEAEDYVAPTQAE